jgi:peroxiredoxin
MSLRGIVRYGLTALTGGAPMLKPGDEAPDFEVRDHNNNTVKLSALRGRRVVLWFYPKADTPG